MHSTDSVQVHSTDKYRCVYSIGGQRCTVHVYSMYICMYMCIVQMVKGAQYGKCASTYVRTYVCVHMRRYVRMYGTFSKKLNVLRAYPYPFFNRT